MWEDSLLDEQPLMNRVAARPPTAYVCQATQLMV